MHLPLELGYFRSQHLIIIALPLSYSATLGEQEHCTSCLKMVLDFTEVQRNIHHLGSHAYKREQNSNTNKTIGLNIKD